MNKEKIIQIISDFDDFSYDYFLTWEELNDK